MFSNNKDFADELTKVGLKVGEEVWNMPVDDSYEKDIKSDIADMKNVGPAEAGQITAGKFLEHFTDYPWIHLDIAGPAFLSSDDQKTTLTLSHLY